MASWASLPSCAKLAESMEGASSIFMRRWSLLMRKALYDGRRTDRFRNLSLELDAAPRDSGAIFVALEGQFEGEHDVKGLLGRNQRSGNAKNGVAEIGIEVAPIAQGGNFAGGCGSVGGG